MGNYTELDVWCEAIDLVGEIYSATQSFPEDERFGLTAQLRRAAVSVPSNIAEGEGRHYRRDYARFVDCACGSVAEIETQLVIAERLGYLDFAAVKKLKLRTARIGRMLNGLLTYLRPRGPGRGPKR